MIRRLAGDRFILIAQHDHALLAGELASRYGNGRFARPDPWEATVAAAAHHDAGWPLHDAAPTLNAAGLPTDVFETPLRTALRVWAEAAELASRHGDYAQLLVSLHVMGLSGYAATNPHTREELFDLNCFQQREIERQELLRRRLGLRTDLPLRLGLAVRRGDEAEEQLRRNHQVIQVVDRISLALCCSQMPFDVIEDVIPRPGAGPLCIRFARSGEASVRVDPWPFDCPQVHVSVPARSVPARPYESVEALHEVYNAADIERLEMLVHPGQ